MSRAERSPARWRVPVLGITLLAAAVLWWWSSVGEAPDTPFGWGHGNERTAADFGTMRREPPPPRAAESMAATERDEATQAASEGPAPSRPDAGPCPLIVRVLGQQSRIPITGAHVEVAPAGRFGGGWSVAQVTDMSGTAAFEGLPEGWSEILVTLAVDRPEFWARSEVTLVPGPQPTKSDVWIDEAAGVIAGWVRDETGRPIIGATTTLVLNLPPGSSAAARAESRYRRVQSDAEGRYEIRDVRPRADLVLGASAHGFTAETRRSVVVVADQESRLDFALAPDRVVRGRLRFRSGTRPAWVRVSAVVILDPKWLPGMPLSAAAEYYGTHPTRVGDSGEFEFPVEAHAAAITIVASADGLLPVTQQAALGPRASPTPELELVLDSPGRAVSGVVVDASGEAVRATIEFHDPEAQVSHAIVSTDAAGRFSCGGLAPLRYSLRVKELDDGRGRSTILRDVEPDQVELRIVLADRD